MLCQKSARSSVTFSVSPPPHRSAPAPPLPSGTPSCHLLTGASSDTSGARSPKQHAHAVESPAELYEEAEKAAAPAYLVKLDGDMLRVFAEGSRTPAAEYELPADWLPDYDRILLEYGIRVRDTAELRQILEDYVS